MAWSRSSSRTADAPPVGVPTGTAHAQALRWLLARPHSASELHARLAAKGFAAEAVQAAIEAMRRYGYIDDMKLADMVRASAARRGKGPQWIAHTLARRGVESEAAHHAARVSEHESLAQATALVARRFGGPGRSIDQKLRQRAMRFLAARGFSGSCAGAAIKAVLSTPQAQDMDEDMC